MFEHAVAREREKIKTKRLLAAKHYNTFRWGTKTIMKSVAKLNATGRFATFDLPGVKQVVPKEGDAAASDSKRDKDRANKESGSRIESAGLIGGPFKKSNGEDYIASRSAVFDRLFSAQESKKESLPDTPITITLPDGTTKPGVAMKTTPMDIAIGIAQGLANSVIISRVKYTKRLDDEAGLVEWEDEEMGGMDVEDEEQKSAEQGELWDLSRPLVGDCQLSLIKYDPDDSDVKTVFWHSAAHVLGAAIESTYGAHLTIGPPLQSGFYYDAYMGNNTLTDEDLKTVEAAGMKVCNAKHKFERLVLSKAEALEMFAANPFKTSLIGNKIPDGGMTSVYRCGPIIDLCMGPHLPTTGKIKAFAATKCSATNWLGQVTNDPLQRVYGIAFPDKAMMKKYKEFQEKAKARDHRNLGTKQELFFFHNLSPGSAFWLPHGARVFNKLVAFIKNQYWERGYEEVITPNMFNLKLWEQSGHAAHYKDNMFVFDVEKEEFGLKPMNCPGHCLLFAHRIRSYRELPLRVADFGVLHRNELSGALSGLTRVRRFQQDDAHIFCRQDQIKEEVIGALDFMAFVYGVFGMTYKLELSTRPK
jgi:threonyl-tRNA synthetase